MNINININNFAKSNLNHNHLYDRAKKLVDRAISCKAINDFYEQAKATPDYKTGVRGLDWTVRFVPKVFMEFEAQCDGVNRELDLWETLSDDEALVYFVFELTNAVSWQRHEEVWNKAIKGQLTSEEFAKESEAIEFEGSEKESEIMKSAIQEMLWDPSLNRHRYIKNWNFERFWHSVLRFTTHAQYYRNSFARLGKPVQTIRLKEKFESAKFLATHLSLRDLGKMSVIGIICGIAAGIFAGMSVCVAATVTAFSSASAYWILSPFTGLKSLFDFRTFRIFSVAAGVFFGFTMGICSKSERLQKIALPILKSAFAILASGIVGYELGTFLEM